jgi:hypothetical protein
MTRIPRILAAPAAALALLTALAPASRAATQDRLRVEVLVDGRAAREYRDHGTSYVEARDGREYAIRVTNLEPDRVAVALAVDGRNTIDGARTPALQARKWILEPWQSIVVSGWQVGQDRARRFYFTTDADSYAAELGDTRNLGLIEAVAFREREDVSRYEPEDDRWSRDARDSRDSRDSNESRHDGPGREQSRGAAPEPAPPKSATAQGAAKAQNRASADSASRYPSEEEDAATGIGRDVRHDVRRVDFEHEDYPSSSVRIRYEFRSRLEAMGIIPPPYRDDRDSWRRREHATGFDDWCPEPDRRR